MGNKKKTAIEQKETIPKNEYRRENYCKFPRIRSELLADLEAGISAKESAKRLGISEQTYYKYKGLICSQLGMVFTVPEEKTFLERHMPAIEPATIAKVDAKSKKEKL